MKETYVEKKFGSATLSLIQQINEIITDYQQQGFRLTVRQIYYQCVSKNVIANTLQEYKRLASIINDGKLAGLIDWEAIEDRTRDFVRRQRWDSGADILKAVVKSFHKDMWIGQDSRVFVIVEKEALVGVLEPTCRKFDVPLLAARGYPSGTVLREFAESDIIPCINENKTPVILHLGDHDPSGIDMSRDLEERISLFSEGFSVRLLRIALNMDQIKKLKPPENPAKITDSRFAAYTKKYGDKSWELDALSPSYLAKLLTDKIEEFIEPYEWNEVEDEIMDVKRRIGLLSKDFE